VIWLHLRQHLFGHHNSHNPRFRSHLRTQALAAHHPRVLHIHRQLPPHPVLNLQPVSRYTETSSTRSFRGINICHNATYRQFNIKKPPAGHKGWLQRPTYWSISVWPWTIPEMMFPSRRFSPKISHQGEKNVAKLFPPISRISSSSSTASSKWLKNNPFPYRNWKPSQHHHPRQPRHHTLTAYTF
jgi:hypothetical protein